MVIIMGDGLVITFEHPSSSPKPNQRPRVARMKMRPVYSIYHPATEWESWRCTHTPAGRQTTLFSLPFFLSFHPLDTPLYPIPHAVLPTLDRKTLHQLGCEAAPSSSSANWLHHSITTARIGRHVLTQPQQQHGNGDCTTMHPAAPF